MFLSIIIPTRNRLLTLVGTVNSLLNQSLDKKKYEILIVDQSTNQDTKEFISLKKNTSDYKIKYIYNNIPGLHSSRNIGAKKAIGDVLIFTDDDVCIDYNYLEIVFNSFKDSLSIAIMTGKILPIYKGKLPEWINYFWENYNNGKYIWQISLLDLGNEKKEISPNLIFGCNYIIRRDLYVKFKGTNPDAFPKELIKYSGNSEIALSYKINESGLKIVYNPDLVIYHIVSKEKLTEKYFYDRNYFEGIKKSYDDIRKTRKRIPLKQTIRDFFLVFKSVLIFVFKFYSKADRVKLKCNLNSFKGKVMHKWWVLRDRKLFEYIIRDNYFDDGKEFI